MIRYWGTVVCIFVCVMFAAGSCPAGTYRSFDDLHPAAIIISDNTLATYLKARSIAEGAGARGMQMFPSEAIFGFFPTVPEPASFEGLSVRLCFTRGELAGTGLSEITARIVGDLLSRTKSVSSAVPAAAEMPIDDQVFRVPEDVVRATTPAGPRRGSPSEIEERGIDQNSEFLIGSVLVNVVFPESAGNGENWTDQELSEALAAISLGLSEYQQHAQWVPLSFTLNYKKFKRVPVTMEPILSNSDTDYLWIGDALRYLGSQGENVWIAAHELNSHARDSLRTDWVFTAFVVDMSNHYTESPPSPDPGCWLGAGYVAYSYLGGPYLVVPYPACRYGYGLGFGQVFIHEMSHAFWALDEYIGRGSTGPTGTPCSARSGYLSVANRNTLYDSCQTTVPCIMKSGRKSSPLPVCEYTMGQVGLADDNDNSVPDIYEVYPTVAFVPHEGVSRDTFFAGDEVYLDAVMNNAGLPNRNPNQRMHNDYAATLVLGEISMNEEPFSSFKPQDGAWDESSEAMLFTLTGLQAGSNTITVRVRNCVDLSGVAERSLYFVGIKYFYISATPEENRITVDWTTSGEVFDAAFDVVRSDNTTGEKDKVLGTVSVPNGVSASRRAYSFVDSLVQAGHEYRYRLVGKFSIVYRGSTRSMEFSSDEVAETALIPAVGLVSYLLPNPTTNRTSFTVNVPKTFRDMGGDRMPVAGTNARRAPSSIEIRTRVDVGVYNVLGQRIKRIYGNSRFGGTVTMLWDGTDDGGKSVSSGVYFIYVQAGDKKDMRKVVLIR